MSIRMKPVHPIVATTQAGMALVIGLIFLLITSLMAITAMSGVVMQERMAGNLRNASIAESGVDSALRAGERWIRSFHSRGDQLIGSCANSETVLSRDEIDPDDVDAVCVSATTAADQFRTARNWVGSWGASFIHSDPVELISEAQLSSPDGAGMAHRPQFMIENLGVLRCTGCPPGGQSGSHGSVGEAGSSGGTSGSSGGSPPPPNVYRITARSTGATANVIRVAESYYVGIMGDAEDATP